MCACTKYNTTSVAVLLSALVCGNFAPPSPAQNPPPTSAQHQLFQGKTVFLPVGTTFEGRIDTTIGSAKSRTGQRFKISMATPVMANGTEVVIPAGSQIVGEVVEAIPAGHQKRRTGYLKPAGKLRVQLSELRTPEGASYPLVGTLAPEVYNPGGHTYFTAGNLGGGLGYVGDQNAFNAAAPTVPRLGHIMMGTRREQEQDMGRNALYGQDTRPSTNVGKPIIRSEQVHGRDVYILKDSPVTVRLDAPFKFTITGGVASKEQAFNSAQERATRTGDRRFSLDEPADTQQTQNQGPPASGLPFLQGPAMQPAAPGAPAVPPLQPAAPPAPHQRGSDF